MRASWLFCVVLGNAGCEGCSDAAQLDVDFEVIEPGTGPTNAELLEPLPIGMFRASPRMVVLGTARVGERDVLEIQDDRGSTFVEHTSTGLVLHPGGHARTRMPIVLLPASVKVGMHWRSENFEGVVEDRADEPTQYGTRTVWTVLTGLRSTDAPGDDPGDLVAIKTVRYAEGRGRLTDTGEPTVHMFPLDEVPSPPAATEAPVTLAPALDEGGEPIVIAQYDSPLSATAIERASDTAIALDAMGRGRTEPRLAMQCFDGQGRDHATENSGLPSLDGAVAQLSSINCHRKLVSMNADGTRIYRQAWQADTVWLRPDDSGPAYAGTASAGYDSFGEVVWAPGALIGKPGDSEPGVWYGAHFSLDTAQSVTATRNYGWRELSLESSETISDQLRTYLTPPHLQSSHPIVIDGSTNVVASQHLGGRLRQSTLTGGELSPPNLIGFGPMGRSVVVRPDEREVLYAHGDVVERLVLEPGASRLERVTRLALPAEHVLERAFRLTEGGDRMMVLTTTVVSGFPQVHVWNAPPPSLAVPVDRPALAVNVSASLLDVVVCWPAGRTPQLDGWTLAGAPPAAVIPIRDDTCVLLVRALGQGATDRATPAFWQVVGPIPGVGRMEITWPGPPQIESFPDGQHVGALPGGGLRSVDIGFTAGAVRDESFGCPIGAVGGGVPDAGGNGIWYAGGGAGEVALVGRVGQRCEVLASGSNGIAPARGGGVVVVRYLQPSYILLPTGATVALPPGFVTPTIWVSSGGFGAWSDGTGCWREGIGWYCAKGTDTPRVLDTTGLLASTRSDLLPLPGGQFALLGETDQTWVLDPNPTPMTLVKIADRAITNGTFDSTGRLFAIAIDTLGRGTGVVEVTPAGLVDIAVPDYTTIAGPARITSVAVDESLYVVTLDNGFAFRVRRQ